jgi:hypothetical protein
MQEEALAVATPIGSTAFYLALDTPIDQISPYAVATLAIPCERNSTGVPAYSASTVQ